MKKKSQTKKSPMKAILISAVVLVALVAIGATTYFFATREHRYAVKMPDGKVSKFTLEEMKKELDVTTFYPGIKINGQDVSGKTIAEVTAMFEGDPKLDYKELNITLSVSGKSYPLDMSGVTLESNLPDVIQEAYNYGRTGVGTTEAQIVADRYQMIQLLKTTPKDFTTIFTVSTDKVSDLVHEVLDPLNVAATDATVSSFDVETLAFLVQDAVTGVNVNATSAILDVKSALDSGEYEKTIVVDVTTVEPSILKADLEANLVLVSSTTTSTKEDNNRNTNIRLVCETVNGLVLQPGEFFNYNDYVGKRTAEKGYKEAGGIYDGVLRDELGGGICQVSGTMFHSVMKADLQVDERHPHSWPSGYVDIGTDATVTWGGANFQFTNNTDYPVAIHAVYKDKDNGNGGWCTIEIYGRPIPDGMTIEFVGEVTSSKAPTTKEYVADPTKAVGVTDSVRDPHNQINAVSYQVFYKDGVEIKRVKTFTSFYRMITEQVMVGVLNPDGSYSTVDPSTGAVITPVPTVTTEPTTSSSDAPSSSESST
jgi:vancomycin resistance protein YoaR